MVSLLKETVREFRDDDATIILLLGAEFTQVWARRRGAGIVPEPGAILTTGGNREVGEARWVERGGKGEN